LRRSARTPGSLGGVGHQHAGSPVDGVLAQGATAGTSAGREYHRVSPGQQHRDIAGRGRLQIADDSLRTSLLHIGDVGRVPDQPCGLVTALGEEALQQERDLPTPARDHYAHAVSLVTGIIGIVATPPAGLCRDRRRPLGPPKAWPRSRVAGPVIADVR
jgi:hypothetical protein